MTTDRLVHALAGALILLSLGFSHVHSRHWLWLTAFVGANLFQSAFTRWCLAEKLFIALGAKPTCTVPK